MVIIGVGPSIAIDMMSECLLSITDLDNYLFFAYLSLIKNYDLKIMYSVSFDTNIQINYQNYEYLNIGL